MLDVNQRSLSLARQNAILNQADVTIFESNIYQNVLKKYDYIISNPPIRVGKETLYQILFGAKDHLKENGELWIVINKDQGAKSVIKDLSSVYDVKLVNKNKGFFIIVAKIR
jgi:16S rRNA (guanine1207-N2)-methyltransferase